MRGELIHRNTCAGWAISSLVDLPPWDHKSCVCQKLGAPWLGQFQVLKQAQALCILNFFDKFFVCSYQDTRHLECHCQVGGIIESYPIPPHPGKTPAKYPFVQVDASDP